MQVVCETSVRQGCLDSGRKSHSGGLNVPLVFKTYEWLHFAGHCIRNSYDIGSIFDNIDEYRAYAGRYLGKDMETSTVFEVGFGALPFRMLALMSMGIDVRGNDLDYPVLGGTWQEFREIYKRNGSERFFKSVVRHLLFDSRPWHTLRKELASRGHQLRIEPTRFIAGDVGELELEEDSIDVLYSEDTFEHIPLETLELLMPKLQRWLKKDGIALVRPCMFTGIAGGHLVGWYIYDVLYGKTGRMAEPWEHLRKKRYVANTYLNKLGRQQYRNLFHQYFDILEEKVTLPGLGKEFLTPALLEELNDYTEDDLLTNQVLYVLRKRR